MKLIAKSPNVTTAMGGKVNRLLGRRDTRVYLKWLTQQGKDQKVPQPRLSELQQEFNGASLAERRRLANQVRRKEGLDTIPWRDPPSTGCSTTISPTVPSESRTSRPLPSSDKQDKSTSLTAWLKGVKGPRAPAQVPQTWLSWDDLFCYRMLTGRSYRQDPLHNEQPTQVHLRDLEQTKA